MIINKEKFYFIISEKYARVENNINKIDSTIFTKFRQYEYTLLKARPKCILINKIIVMYKDKETKNYKVYTLISYILLNKN